MKKVSSSVLHMVSVYQQCVPVCLLSLVPYLRESAVCFVSSAHEPLFGPIVCGTSGALSCAVHMQCIIHMQHTNVSYHSIILR